ncbi:MAG: 50S ribosomal protein L30 [Bdellovibrionia bacterium]
MAKTFKVTLKKSTIGCTVTQRETVRCLGLRRPGHVVTVKDTPANRGQIFKVQHLVEVNLEKK